MKSWFPAATNTSFSLQTFSVLKIVHGLCFPTPFCLIATSLWARSPSYSVRSILERFFACVPEQEWFFTLQPKVCRSVSPLWSFFPRIFFLNLTFLVHVETMLICTQWIGTWPLLPVRDSLINLYKVISVHHFITNFLWRKKANSLHNLPSFSS